MFMKKILFILAIAFGSSLHAQITLTREHIINYGKKFVIAYDGSQHSFAASGANKTWDFRNINANYKDSLRFGGADWFKGHSNFPKSNFAFIYYSDTQAINYMHLNDSSLGIEGFYNYTSSSEDIAQTKSTLIRFPSTYNSKFNESHVFMGGVLRIKLDPDTAGPMPFIDSLRIDQTRYITSNIDGWGTIKTPLGSFASIKQTTLDVMAQTYMIKSNGSWKLAPDNVLQKLKYPLPNYDSSYNVNFWTNDANYGFPILSYYYSPRDTNTSDIEWMFGKSRKSSLNAFNTKNLSFFPNPANNSIQISGNFENVVLEIWDMQGRHLNSFNNLESSINIETLELGVYVLKFLDKNTGENLSSQTLIKS